MPQITSAQVKELRERTGVGMMECKKALVAADGDLDAAIEALRKAGQAKAVKKGARTTAEGLVAMATAASATTVTMVELNCETDFVAREARFRDFATAVAQAAQQAQTADLAALQALPIEGAGTVEAQRLELVAQLGENISIRRVAQVTASGSIGAYLHGDPMTPRIGALVALDVENSQLANDIAMQIAAMRPEYLDESHVPEARIAKEKEIFLSQAREQNAGKPDDILEKIIAGKLKKFIKEITLVGQPFVKDSNQTIAQLLASHKASITQYERYEVGEGIEKKTDDFVGEVMAQVKA